MDQEGVREIFYAECGSAPDYGVRAALRSFPYLNRIRESFFTGIHLPLTKPLPKRLDDTLQQHTGLHAYDAIALVDVDPVIFDAEDLLNLQAYVQAGGGLLLMAGPNSFAQAQRNWGPLRETLPADIPLSPHKRKRLWEEIIAGETRPPLSDVRAAEGHPITRGLLGSLGQVRPRTRLAVKPGATVLVTADEEPVIIVGTCGKGRVVMVNADPQEDKSCMFRSTAWGDLLRQTFLWLMDREQDCVVTHCEWDITDMACGEQRALRIECATDAPLPVAATASASRADPGWMSTGREPQFGGELKQEIRIEDRAAEFVFEPDAPGLWRVKVDIRGDEWVNVRQATIPVGTAPNLRLFSRTGEYVTAPGRTLPLQLEADRPVSGTLAIEDSAGAVVHRMEDVTNGAIDVPIPELELGDYEVAAATESEEARFRFCVTDPVDRLHFSLVGLITGHNEEQSRRNYEYFRTRGFDAFATAVPTQANAPGFPDGFRAAPFQHYLVQRDGHDLWGEYIGATLLKLQRHVGDEGSEAMTPCVFDPEHKVKLRELLQDRFRSASVMPRLVSLEIHDEPHIYPTAVCRCDLCKRAFRDKHGYELPTWKEALATKDHRTKDYFEWIVDYVGEAFRLGYETWKSFGSGPWLHHVMCAMGSGSRSVLGTIAEDLPWAKHADFLEFDCYNYMYAHWRPLNQLRWNEFHYLMGHFRFLALRNEQRFGFFIQVTDRDVPVSPWDPLRAPSETLYTAVGHGAKTFHLMHQGPFSNSQNCREEKFDTFAADIRKVQRLAPLLDKAEAPRRRIAMVFPFHDRLYRYPEPWLPEGYIGLGFYGREQRPLDTTWPYHAPSVNIAELLVRAFGETDVIDQRAFHEGALESYGGFALTTTDYISDADAEALVRFVQSGGSLVCDHVPSHSTDGGPSTILESLFTGDTRHFYRDVTVRESAVGQGRTLLFSSDLNELYTTSFEEKNKRLVQRIEETVREFFFAGGLRPHVLSANPEIEANVLLTPDTVVVVAVNHADVRKQSTLTVFAPAIPVSHAVDLVTMQEHGFRRDGENLVIETDLDEREGLVLGLYASIPSSITLRPHAATAKRGERLTFDVLLKGNGEEELRGDHIVELSVTDAGGTERRRYSGLRCAANGMLTIDQPLAVNARTGSWKLAAFDPISTRQATTTVEVV